MSPRLVTVLLVAGTLSLAAIVLAVVGRADHGPAPEEPGAAAPASRFEGSVVPPGVRTPDFVLRDQDGRPVSMRALRGRPAVVTFLYTHCKESCPAEAQQIKGALDDLGRDVPVLAISVAPEEDTPASARHFIEEQGMTGRMDFVLGSRPELARLWRGFAIAPQTAEGEHQARIALIDADGYQRVGFPGEQATPERIAHDLRELGA